MIAYKDKVMKFFLLLSIYVRQLITIGKKQQQQQQPKMKITFSITGGLVYMVPNSTRGHPRSNPGSIWWTISNKVPDSGHVIDDFQLLLNLDSYPSGGNLLGKMPLSFPLKIVEVFGTYLTCPWAYD